MCIRDRVQSLNVLAMTGDELERFLQRELEDNPLLEPPEYTDSSFSEPFSLSGHGAPSEAPEHGDIPLPDRPSLRDHLLSQLNERSIDVYKRQVWHAAALRYLPEPATYP